MIFGLITLSGALLATAFGQLMYKLYFQSGGTHYLSASIVFFLIAPVCAYLALGVLYIGTVYMSTAITQLLVVGLSRYVLGERLTIDHGIAMFLIVTGVLLYAYQT